MADRGVKFVCRYLVQSPPPFLQKACTRSELDRYFALGIAVVLNGETSEDAALLGALRGAVDAVAYVAAARKLGAPPGTCIVVSHDTSAWSEQVPRYFAAAYDVIVAAGYTFGVYGSGQIIEDCLDRGMVLTIMWATMSWAWPGGVHPLAHFRQGQVAIDLAGMGSVDGNLCKRPFHAWHPTTKPAPPVPTPAPPVVAPLPKDSPMRLVYTTDQLGIWFINGDSITHLDGDGAAVLRKLGVPGNFDPASWVDADELATLQELFPGPVAVVALVPARQISGVFTGTTT